jgi:hypothetical protein
VPHCDAQVIKGKRIRAPDGSSWHVLVDPKVAHGFPAMAAGLTLSATKTSPRNSLFGLGFKAKKS